MKKLFFVLVHFLALTIDLLGAQPDNEALEPKVEGAEVVTLIEDDSLAGWRVPSERWSIADGVITGDTQGKEAGRAGVDLY